MPVSVSTIAQNRNLARLDRVKAELGITGSTHDTVLNSLIAEASTACESYCSRIFARQVYSETCPGYGGTELQLGRAPVVAVTSVLRDTETITDYELGDRDQGFLYRQGGWDWTVQSALGLSGRQEWPAFGTPLVNAREPIYTIAYTAGYTLPPQWRESVTTIAAVNTDNSITDSASLFPPLLKAGDVVETSGFTNAANNGRSIVSGTPTTAKIVLSGLTLTAETAGASVTVRFPGHVDTRPFYDAEKACMECVKSWFAGRASDSSVVEKQMALARIRYREGDNLGIPPLAAALLRPWVTL